jgi:iron(III) transport system ATP-binding protein
VAGLTLRGIRKRFAGGGAPAVDAVDLTVADGEFLAVLGPSGSGKSTLLRLVAGLETVDAGEIAIGARIVSAPGRHLPPEDRGVGMVFQSYALWPHMTVRRNVGFPLEVRGVRGAAYAGRVGAALATVGLAGLEERRPAQLSGGQRQRVALARCLVMDPAVVLLDEPLASLDPHLRSALQEEFTAFHRATGATLLYVTHDQGEAMALAHRIAVLDGGRLVQVAPARDLYREPATPMVARFVGRGAVVPATVLGPAREGRVPADVLGLPVALRAAPGQAPGPALACLRPEDLRPAAPERPGLAGQVARAAFQGGFVAVDVAPAGAGALRLPLALPPGAAPEPGAPLRVAVEDGWVIPGPAG